MISFWAMTTPDDKTHPPDSQDRPRWIVNDDGTVYKYQGQIPGLTHKQLDAMRWALGAVRQEAPSPEWETMRDMTNKLIGTGMVSTVHEGMREQYKTYTHLILDGNTWTECCGLPRAAIPSHHLFANTVNPVTCPRGLAKWGHMSAPPKAAERPPDDTETEAPEPTHPTGALVIDPDFAPQLSSSTDGLPGDPLHSSRLDVKHFVAFLYDDEGDWYDCTVHDMNLSLRVQCRHSAVIPISMSHVTLYIKYSNGRLIPLWRLPVRGLLHPGRYVSVRFGFNTASASPTITEDDS